MIRDNDVSGRRLETGRRSESIIYTHSFHFNNFFNGKFNSKYLI